MILNTLYLVNIDFIKSCERNIQFLISKFGFKYLQSHNSVTVIAMNTFIGIVLLVLFALDPGAAFKMVPDTVAEEALAAAQEPTAGDATRDEDECTFNWTDPATGRSSCYRLEDERLDFSSAEAHCVVHHGGHLAAITTIAENDNMKLNLIGHEVSAPKIIQ